MVKVSSWGRLSHEEHNVRDLCSPFQYDSAFKGLSGSALAFGMGKSYGDVCLNPGGTLWETKSLDRFISFDQISGRLTCESGVLLCDIQELLVPRGWMLPVTPGTQLITVGGAIANDVHGKNHHVYGTFGDHIQKLVLARSDGEIIECGPSFRREWFSATLGGIGLTGLILSAEIQLRPVVGPWLDTETLPYANLDEFFELADQSEDGWEHTVSWIDCVSGGGRGIFMRGNHSASVNGPMPSKRKKSIPFELPISMVNKASLRGFNELYYALGKLRAGKERVHYEPFFYPLDNILSWNRMYGPKGFFQYQCLIPREYGKVAIDHMLQAIAKSGTGSFLAVLKTFGNREPLGMLSFAKSGVTLALDFPNKGSLTKSLFDKLDGIVKESNGRIYLAKDARMPRGLFETSYSQVSNFIKYRDPAISSAMSRRLMDF